MLVESEVRTRFPFLHRDVFAQPNEYYEGVIECPSGVRLLSVCKPWLESNCLTVCRTSESQPEPGQRVAVYESAPEAEGFQSTGWHFFVFVMGLSFLLAYLAAEENRVNRDNEQYGRPRRAAAVASAWKSAQYMRAYKMLHQE